jgi:3',5'-cyclic AMP phosphodiesterase CpdA
MFSIAHLSDLHATPVRPDHPGQLAGKRLLGWLSWRANRRHHYRPEVLAALIDDLHGAAADHVVVTGDVTNIGLPSEFAAGRDWLERIGPPERVFAIPGNHDAYVRIARERSWDHWSDYLAGDGEAFRGDFPTLRRRGPLALVGVCSAVPAPWFLATGRVGAAQLERLGKLLEQLGGEGLTRVVLIHHPVVPGATSWRRALTDGAAFRETLRRAGAELVLHGHNHRTQLAALPGPSGPIPVVGVRSASYAGATEEKLARYHVYDFEPDSAGTGARIRLRTRAWDRESGRFVPAGEEWLAAGA